MDVETKAIDAVDRWLHVRQIMQPSFAQTETDLFGETRELKNVWAGGTWLNTPLIEAIKRDDVNNPYRCNIKMRLKFYTTSTLAPSSRDLGAGTGVQLQVYGLWFDPFYRDVRFSPNWQWPSIVKRTGPGNATDRELLIRMTRSVLKTAEILYELQLELAKFMECRVSLYRSCALGLMKANSNCFIIGESRYRGSDHLLARCLTHGSKGCLETMNRLPPYAIKAAAKEVLSNDLYNRILDSGNIMQREVSKKKEEHLLIARTATGYLESYLGREDLLQNRAARKLRIV